MLIVCYDVWSSIHGARAHVHTHTHTCTHAPARPQAEGHLSADTHARVHASLDLQPADMPGYLRLSGSAQLPSRLVRGQQPAVVVTSEEVPEVAEWGEGAVGLAERAPGLEGREGQRESGEGVEQPTGSGHDADSAAAASQGSGSAGSGGLGAGGREQHELDAQLVVRDGGMALLGALVPGCEWQSGAALIDLRAYGKLLAPDVRGVARVSRATLLSPYFRGPVTNLAANIKACVMCAFVCVWRGGGARRGGGACAVCVCVLGGEDEVE